MKIGSLIFKPFLLLIFLLFSLNVYAWEEMDYYLYYGTTAESTTVAWADPRVTTPADTNDDYDPLTDHFEISIYNKERNIERVIVDNIPGDVFQYTFKLPQTGHWITKIRGVRHSIVDGVEENTVTGWSESINATVAEVNGLPKAWWLFAWIAPAGPIVQILDIPVQLSEDDAEEKLDNTVNIISSDLELVTDVDVQTVGLKFNTIMLPKAATIYKAYIQFEVDEVSIDSTWLKLEGEAIDLALPFTTSTGNITNRTRTTSNVEWSPLPWANINESGPDQRTPDISHIIKEIRDRSGWIVGNSMVFIITGTGKRVAKAFDGDPSGSALLHIEYHQ